MSGWEQITNTLIPFFPPFSRMRWKQWDAKGLPRKSHMEERAIVVLVPLLIISMALDTALFKATASWRALTALPSWCPWSIRPPEKPVQYWEYYCHKKRSEVGRLYLKSHGYLKWAVNTPVQKIEYKSDLRSNEQYLSSSSITLHRNRRGHGFVQIPYRPRFFQALFSLLLKQCSSLPLLLPY